MELKEMIYKRKSVRSYTDEPVDEETIAKIKSFVSGIKPLYPDIKVSSEIVDKESVKCILPWITPQLVAIFSEEKEGYLENVGFIFQQLDLYLQSIGMGVCWLGMGRLSEQDAVESKDENMKFVILLTFGYPKGVALRNDISEFKRKKLSEIADKHDERLDVARLAPSSVNSQPWYFIHEGDTLHAYCITPRFFKVKTLGNMNRIDIGIALAHMYIANAGTFRFFKCESVEKVKGYEYIGSFSI